MKKLTYLFMILAVCLASSCASNQKIASIDYAKIDSLQYYSISLDAMNNDINPAQIKPFSASSGNQEIEK